MNNIIYLGTTIKCSACKLQESIINKVLQDRNDVDFIVCDYTELPDYIKTNIKLTDFPITIFVKDNIIKYNFVGTKAGKLIKEIINDIKF